MREITGALKISDKKTTRAAGESTLLILADGTTKVCGPNVFAGSGDPRVKMFVGTDAEVTTAKLAEEAKLAVKKEIG